MSLLEPVSVLMSLALREARMAHAGGRKADVGMPQDSARAHLAVMPVARTNAETPTVNLEAQSFCEDTIL